MCDALARTVVPAWDAAGRIDVAMMLGIARHGPADPAYRRIGSSVWRAVNTPEGPATICVDRVSIGLVPTDTSLTPEGGVRIRAWGDGAAWALGAFPSMMAHHDDAHGFDVASLASVAHHPALRESAQVNHLRWRPAPVAGLVDHLVASILEQRVTAIEAHHAWRVLVGAHGMAAPGPAGVVPAGLTVPPAPALWRRIPSWQWHRAGVDRSRADTVMRALGFLRDAEPMRDLETVVAGLASVPGIGEWTLALVRQAVLGDPDAVQFGDFHTCHDVVFALTGQARACDSLMREALEPWSGHRHRVVRLVEFARISAPRRGPRLAPAAHRFW